MHKQLVWVRAATSRRSMEEVDGRAERSEQATASKPDEDIDRSSKRGLVPRRAIDFVRFDDANDHGRSFASSDVARRLKEDPAFESWSRHRGIKKEITEAYAALSATRRALRDQELEREAFGDGEDLVFVELCSGRGFISIVFADAFPKARLYMVDNDDRMDVTHLDAYDPDRLSFHLLDLHSAECEAFIRDIVNSAGLGKTVVLVGVHLCGTLAHRAIELYENVEGVCALVVSPCCLPRRRRHDVFGFHCVDIARSITSLSPYQCWCTQLYFRIPYTSRRNMLADEDMLSTQNTFITARKPGFGASLDSLQLKARQPTIVAGSTRAKWKILAR
jgi:hypothetical protein